MDEKRGLQDFLSHLRARITPADVGLAPAVGRGRRAPGLTQHQVAVLTQHTTRWYERVERGEIRPRESELAQLADLLRLNDAERVELWVRALGHEPITDAVRLDGPCASLQAVLPALDQQSGLAAYVTDFAWNLVLSNAAFAAVFPGRAVPHNLFEWMVWDGASQLLDHTVSWRIPLLKELDYLRARHPGDQRLRRLSRRVEADPEVYRLFREHRWCGEDHSQPALRLHHAGLNRTATVAMLSSEPLTAPGNRLVLMTLMPEAPAVRQDQEQLAACAAA